MYWTKTSPSYLYNCSQDSTIRCVDIDRQINIDVVRIEQGDGAIHSISVTPDEKTMYASTTRGELLTIDIRNGPSASNIVSRNDVHKHKIGCVSVNPVHTNYLSTASNDRTVKIWDIRTLKRELGEFSHGYSVGCVKYFFTV